MRLARLSAAWLAGVLLGALGWLEAAALAAGGATVAVSFRARRPPLEALLALALLVGGGIRFRVAEGGAAHAELAALVGQRATVQGTVLGAPEPRGAHQRLLLAVERAGPAEQDGALRPVTGAVLAWFPRYSSYQAGERLQLTGRLAAPERFGGFDYPGYLARRGIVGTMAFAEVERLGQGPPGPTERLSAVRRALAEALARALPEPEASVAGGLFYGYQSSLPALLRDAFYATGTVHLLVVSGYNLSLVAGALAAVLSGMIGRRAALLPITAAIATYAAVVGGDPPVLRAAVMVTFGLVAAQLGRPASALGSLGFAAALLTVAEPLLLWEASFHLSFLSMAGVLFLAPPLRALVMSQLERLHSAQVARSAIGAVHAASEIAVTSTAALIATAPVIALHFQRFSVIAPLANLLAQPLVPVAMLATIPVAIAGAVAPGIAPLLSFPAWLVLRAFTSVVEAAALVPFAAVSVPPVPGWPVALLYLALLLPAAVPPWLRSALTASVQQLVAQRSSWSVRWSVHRSAWLPLALAAVAVALWAILLSTEDDRRLTVHFMDVGQGDAILVEAPSGARLLVDGGPNPELLLARLGRSLPWWDRNLEALVLTHPQADHMNGLIEVARRYQVGLVIEGPATAESEAYRAWEALLAENRTERLRLAAGDRFQFGGVIGEALGPDGLSGGNDNDRSLVLRLSYGVVSFLLPGDIEGPGETALLRAGLPLASTVLKVAHHGSATSTGRAFLDRVDPIAAVISVGAGNRFGHPSAEVLQRLEGRAIYRTDLHGTIVFTTDGRRLWVRTER